MNREELLAMHEDLCAEARKLMERKNHDYASGKVETEPFGNFTRVASMGVTTVEKGFLVRMVDKMSRLSTFAQEGEFRVEDESLRDTIMDLINYGVLLYAYVQSKSEDHNSQETNE
tara:strand:- start:314 stop:661 length:348 start_codon:yes stop_codon:yes gene_type:complete